MGGAQLCAKISNALKTISNKFHRFNKKKTPEKEKKNKIKIKPKDKKRSGAYQWGSYKVLPYVSLNYENNMDSVSTLIHEMGHAMHSYLSDNTQEFIYAQYPIFLAEIASTVNEILFKFRNSFMCINELIKNEN